jgi:hypothetical protein
MSDGQEFDSPIVLISAPGAMGKSEAAKGIAESLRTLYVDLARINVGNGTLVGELVKALGSAQMEQYSQDVREGRATLVLDSTDEAQLRSGSENFLEFLKDLNWFIDDSIPGPRIVLLGRSDSIAITEIALKLIDRPSPVVELQPLNYEQACRFIDSTLNSSQYKLHSEQPEPFARLRDVVLAGLARSLTAANTTRENLSDEWDQTESFLGYPPVLLALAERLKVANPQAEVSRLAQHDLSTVRQQRGKLLRTIVEYILDREANKVRLALGESLGIRASGPEGVSLYGRDEQVARLLDFTGTSGVTLDRPVMLAEDERARYEELITGFVQDHPFVRGTEFASPVFSDYMRAWAVSSPVSELLTVERAPFLSSLPHVGPFFARFLAALTPEGQEPAIPEDLVDDAIKSHAVGSLAAHSWYRHRDGFDAKLRLLDDDAHMADDDLEFKVVEAAGALVLNSPLSRAAFFTDFGLILRSGASGQMDIGPGVLLVADEIEMTTKVFRVVSSNDAEDGSVVIARGSVRHDRDLRVVSYGARDLVVNWPDHWHQWTPYVVSMDTNAGDAIDWALATQVMVAVRKLLQAFRRTSQAPAVSADKVDRILVGGNDVALTVKDALMELGVVELAGNQYQLRLHRLGDLGVSWQDILAEDPFKALSGFCEKVINTRVFSSKYLGG